MRANDPHGSGRSAGTGPHKDVVSLQENKKPTARNKDQYQRGLGLEQLIFCNFGNKNKILSLQRIKRF